MLPDGRIIRDYLTITGGVLGRLVISLVYFLVVANTLAVSDFGLFAATAAVGLILSRLLAFGFISPVYRAATVKPRLLGVYCAGLGALSVLSLPVVAGVALLVHALFFESKLPLWLFAVIVAAEVVGVRVMEFSAITLNGLSRFGQAARLAVMASAIRTAAALVFLFAGQTSLAAWAWLNLAAALGGAALGLLWVLPSLRLRFVWAVYPRRLRDAVMTAASELAFYAQAELDKVVVLTFAGERAAGVYAIAMRLIDLTAIPIRSFNQMLVQRRMRDAAATGTPGQQALIECGIAAVSVAGLVGFIVLLTVAPGALGGNVARAAPVLLPMLMIPALRNLVEYHGELLYARELVVTRLALLCGLTALKLWLTAWLVAGQTDIAAWAWPLTGVFAIVYAASALVTYGRLRAHRPA